MQALFAFCKVDRLQLCVLYVSYWLAAVFELMPSHKLCEDTGLYKNTIGIAVLLLFGLECYLLMLFMEDKF